MNNTEKKLNDALEELNWWKNYALRIEEGVIDIRAIVNESEGVAGYHLNGDIAKWDEILSGSLFETTEVDIKDRKNGHITTDLKKELYIKSYENLPCTVQYTPIYGGAKYIRE